MTADKIRIWRERVRWCIAQADAIERDLPPRSDCDPKTMAEMSVDFWRGMAASIEKELTT